MNPVITKFGFTDINGYTGDMNTAPIKGELPPSPLDTNCQCLSHVSPYGYALDQLQSFTPCACDKVDTVRPRIEYLGVPAQSTDGCLQHQAPGGYQYVNKNGQCVLIDLKTGLPPVSPTAAATVLPATTAPTTVVDTATNAISSVTAQIKTLYAANPTLFLVGGAAIAYFVFAKKKH